MNMYLAHLCSFSFFLIMFLDFDANILRMKMYHLINMISTTKQILIDLIQILLNFFLLNSSTELSFLSDGSELLLGGNTYQKARRRKTH